MVIAIKCWLGCKSSACKYCFLTEKEQEFRYDINKVLATLRRLAKEYPNEEIVLHGGEPTDLPKKDVVRFMKEAYRLRGRTSIETNAFNIDNWFIEQFKKYKTSVGVSFDGPSYCNILRGKGTDEQRLEMAKKAEQTIYRLIKEKLPLSLILVIHKKNAIENRDLFKGFLAKLGELGVREGRLNIACITENIPAKKYELSIEEAKDFYKDLYYFCSANGLSYSPFIDITNSLLGKPNVVCIFGQCDIYSTPSIKSILYDGSVANCVKTYHYGFPFPKADTYQPEIRNQLLLETDCQGCRWWPFCFGGCFDSRTEVLTIEGFKPFPLINYSDYIFAYNPETGKGEFMHPVKIFAYPYSGRMINLKSEYIDLLVTPNHVLAGNSRKSRRNLNDLFERWKASEVLEYTSFLVPRALPKWEGKEEVSEEWAEFLGWFLSEGHTYKGNKYYQVGLTSKNPIYLNRFEKLLEDFGYNAYINRSSSQAVVSNKELYNKLYCFGKAKQKFIPRAILDANRRIQSIFLESYCKGDGTFRCGHPSRLYTSSSHLASDLQELAIKLGYGTTMNIDSRDMNAINGHHVKYRNPVYRIGLSKYYNSGKVTNIGSQEYQGMVYDVNVNDRIIAVRRNGKASLSYNCPNHGISSDWRRKDKFCPAYQMLFELISKDLQSKGLRIKSTETPKFPTQGDHTDGIAHSDGTMRHLDGFR
jgi:radical SAM protein with 4Fe4S-binding SPASM domain